MDLPIIVAMIFMSILFGLLAGLLIASLFSGREPKSEEAAGSTKADTPEGEAPNQDILKLRRDSQGALQVSLGGSFYQAPGQLEPSQRKQLGEIGQQLAGWLQEADQPLELKQQPCDAALEPERGVSRIQPVKPAPLSYLLERSHSQPKAGPESLAGQINKILQEQIAAGPLAEKKVEVVDSPSGGIQILLDADHYEGIDQVPDEEVRAAIRAAVKTWERQSFLNP
jgi:hypothetical protein